MARKFNFNPQPVSIPNGGMADKRIRDAQVDMAESQADIMRDRADAVRRSPISGFGADGRGGFDYYGEDAAIRAGFDGIVLGANRARADRARRGRATLSSIYGHAMRNGNMIPRELAPSVGLELGVPDFVGGTILPDGSLMTLKRGGGDGLQPGSIVPVQGVVSAAVSSGDAKTARAVSGKYMKGRYTDAQIEQMTGYSDAWYRGQVSRNMAMADRKFKLEQMKILADMNAANAKQGKPPMTPAEFFSKNPKLTERLSAEIERDEKGDIILDEATGEPKMAMLPPDKAAARCLAFFNGISAGDGEDEGAAKADPFQQSVIDAMRSLSAAEQKSPEQIAMERRAAQRANVLDATNGRQSLVIRRNADGSETYVNGYVVDGRVYDADLNEMKGEFFDRDGEPIVPSQAPVAAQQARGGAPSLGEDGSFVAPDGEVTKIGGIRTDMNGRKFRFLGGSLKNWEEVKSDAAQGATGTPLKPLQQVNGATPAQGGAGNALTQPLAQKSAQKPVQESAAQADANYDTALTPEEEADYQLWRSSLPKALQYEGDYDLRGYFKDPETQKDNIADGSHFTDKYKKPNHPTFSVESQYATGKNAELAGRWDENDNYVPSEARLRRDEQARIKEFTSLQGKYEEDEDGNVRVQIADWDYLPEKIKAAHPDRYDELGDDTLRLQRQAAEAKHKFEQNFKEKVVPRIEADARKRFPTNMAKRRKFVETEKARWLGAHDPAKVRERNESVGLANAVLPM